MIRVKQVWMDHSGRTKFYQIFVLVAPDAGKRITIFHYGPLRGKPRETWMRPVNGGQQAAKAGDHYVTKCHEKEARGYEVSTVTESVVEDHAEWLVTHFGAALADKYHQMLFGAVVGVCLLPTDDADNEILAGKAEAEPEARPEHWGSW